MAACRPILFFFFFSLLFFFFPATNKVSAQLKINEFLPNPPPENNEWVEIYNPGAEEISLSGWYLADSLLNENSHKMDLSSLGKIAAGDLVVYEYSRGDGWLNNSSGDTVYLMDHLGQIIDSYGYEADPGEGKSFGRYPDGGNDWRIYDHPTKGTSNIGEVLEENPLPSPAPTPSTGPLSAGSSPSPSPTAIYDIKEVKDKNGRIISQVKIYIDGRYTHHYAPERLIFCQNCVCDGEVACDFGRHIIRLEKSGYQNWEEVKIFQANDLFVANPIMEPVSLPTPTITPVVSASPITEEEIISPPASSRVSTTGGDILGEEISSSSAFYPLEETATPAALEKKTDSERSPIFAAVLLGAGAVFLFTAAFSLWYTRIRQRRSE